MRIAIPILILLSFMVASCGDKPVSIEKYYEYYNSDKSGLQIDKTGKACHFNCRYETPEFKAVKEYMETDLLDYHSLDSLFQIYAGANYFKIRVSGIDPGLRGSTYTRNGMEFSYNDYCSLFLQDCFILKSGNDEFPCTGYIFVPGDFVSPYDTYYCVFKQEKPDTRGIELQFDASHLREGTIVFKYTKRIINKIPEIREL